MRRPVRLLVPADAAAASRPSISGICTSMSTRSNGCLASAASASLPLPATTTACPCFSSRRTASFWLTGLSSASSTRSGRPAPCRRPSAPVGGRPVGLGQGRGRGDVGQGGQHGVEQFRLLDGLHQVSVDAQLAAAGHVLRVAGGGQHHQRGAGAVRGVWRMRPARVKPSISGMWASSSTSGNGSPACRRLLEHGQRRPPAVHRQRPNAPVARAPLRGCGGWWRCRRRPAPAVRAARPAAPPRAAAPGLADRPKRAVK